MKIYADGADAKSMLELNENPMISGFTTNPTLMRKAGIIDYCQFAKGILKHIREKPISFEVFSDDFNEMERQALEIKSWGKNVYVKIPVTNTKGESSAPLIKKLSEAGVQLNVTAILTSEQIVKVLAVAVNTPSIISVFAGRIADTGRDPMVVMCYAVIKKRDQLAGKLEVLWASCREALNIYQAEQCGCDIITVPHDILKKLPMKGMDLTALSLDTVKMFYQDALKAGYTL